MPHFWVPQKLCGSLAIHAGRCPAATSASMTRCCSSACRSYTAALIACMKASAWDSRVLSAHLTLQSHDNAVELAQRECKLQACMRAGRKAGIRARGKRASCLWRAVLTD